MSNMGVSTNDGKLHEFHQINSKSHGASTADGMLHEASVGWSVGL